MDDTEYLPSPPCVRCGEETEEDCGSREFACDYCRQSFDASRLCRACYFEPYPLRLCPVCIDAIKEI